MFYIRQSNSSKTHYKRLLNGALSIGYLIRPKSKNVHLQYELSEQIFCRLFDAENIAGLDLSIDAKNPQDGIGIKTFTSAKLHKIAEFNDNTKYQFSSDDNRTMHKDKFSSVSKLLSQIDSIYSQKVMNKRPEEIVYM